MMLSEPAGQRLGQCRDLGPEPPLRQISQHRRIALALTSACSINRPDTPVISEATLDNLMPASPNNFSSRWISRPRSRVIIARAWVAV